MSKPTYDTIKEEYKVVELEIFIHTKGKWKAFYFLRHIFNFLRKNHQLCKQNDYKELYEETVVLLILYAHAKGEWTIKEPKNQQMLIELLADLENKKSHSSFEEFSIKTIDDYLAYRKRMWENGEKHTKEKYGFIS